MSQECMKVRAKLQMNMFACMQSMWLALEEAMEAGMQFPDVLFLYNGGDQPMKAETFDSSYHMKAVAAALHTNQ
eukprot:1157816-Pelagomonas_calceolata.AAC.3